MATKVVGEPIEGRTINPEKAVFTIEKAKKINIEGVITEPNPADTPLLGDLLESGLQVLRHQVAELESQSF
jgi:hypothetical protein